MNVCCQNKKYLPFLFGTNQKNNVIKQNRTPEPLHIKQNINQERKFNRIVIQLFSRWQHLKRSTSTVQKKHERKMFIKQTHKFASQLQINFLKVTGEMGPEKTLAYCLILQEIWQILIGRDLAGRSAGIG